MEEELQLLLDMKTRFDFVGSELDWFARDAEGCVGLFSSAGWGPIPDFVFEHFDEQRAIEQQLHAFVGSDSTSLPAYFDVLLEYGIFCFDWEDTFGPYRRHAIAHKTSSIIQIEFSLELQASLVVLPECQFRLCSELQEHALPPFTDVRR